MDPREVLEAAARETFSDEEHGEIALRLKPGLDAAEIACLESDRGLPFPEGVRRLLTLARGFDLGGLGDVEFLGRSDFAFTAAFPRGVSLATDGFGNYWVVDVHPATGAWGPVYFACHDPPVIVAQSPDLGHFLHEYFNLVRPGKESALENPTDGAVLEIWSRNPDIVLRDPAATSPDATLAEFARGLAPEFEIADLRTFRVGRGFTWGRNGPDTVILRHPTEALFGIQKPTSFFGRFFG